MEEESMKEKKDEGEGGARTRMAFGGQLWA